MDKPEFVTVGIAFKVRGCAPPPSHANFDIGVLQQHGWLVSGSFNMRSVKGLGTTLPFDARPASRGMAVVKVRNRPEETFSSVLFFIRPGWNINVGLFGNQAFGLVHVVITPGAWSG
jgi:hypothetical protein